MPSQSAAAQPRAILRGHRAQVHGAAFIRNNSRLVTGDADGFVVVWDLTIMRPRAVWQAHTNAILGLAGWMNDRVITHGRDNKLIVWKLAEGDEASLSTVLPLDPSPESRSQPWMLHLLEVNTMNFCTFSACAALLNGNSSEDELLVGSPEHSCLRSRRFAVIPLNHIGPLTGPLLQIDIFHLPSQNRIHTVKLGDKNGMVMAVSLFYQGSDLVVVAGYENGLAILASLDTNGNLTIRYRTQTHSQPILSLDVDPNKTYFITSSADAVIVKHPVPGAMNGPASPPPSAGRSSDGPLSVDDGEASKKKGKLKSLLSASLDNTQPLAPPAAKSGVELQTDPLKVINTKHAGQQGLRIRSDGRVFATAGWDSRVRVYSAKTMKEVAVLKWHQVGCYTVAFSRIGEENEVPTLSQETTLGYMGSSGEDTTSDLVSTSLEPRAQNESVKEGRVRQAKMAHWLAAGSKDGKISLWDVF